MDRRAVLGDRRGGERRSVALGPSESERRSGRDRRVVAAGRRHGDWVSLPPLSRLIPALVVVATSMANLAVAQATATKGWSMLFVLAAIPIAAYDLANPWRWRWHLAVVWFAVGVYVMAAGLHIAAMVTG